MLKNFMTLLLTALLFIGAGSINAEAKTKKQKSSTSKNYKKSKKGKSSKKSKKTKSRRYKRTSANGPDLRTLTTEKANTEYTEIPDNGGVNSVEKKTGL